MAVERLPGRRPRERQRGSDRRQRRTRARCSNGPRRDGIEITHILVTHPHGDHIAGLAAAASGSATRRWSPTRRPRPRSRPRSPRRSPTARRSTPAVSRSRRSSPPATPPATSPSWSTAATSSPPTCSSRARSAARWRRAQAASTTSSASVMERLMKLPPQTTVHPGHREPTTIGAEWEGNPFVRIWRGLDATERRAVHGLGPRGDAEALGARLRRRQQGLGRLRATPARTRSSAAPRSSAANSSSSAAQEHSPLQT